MKLNKTKKVKESVLGALGQGLVRSLGYTPSGAAYERSEELKARAQLGKESYKEFRDEKIRSGLLNRFGALIPNTGVSEEQIAKDAIRFATDFFASKYGSSLGLGYINQLQNFIKDQEETLDTLGELPFFFNKVADEYNRIRDLVDKTLPASRTDYVNKLAAAINTFKPDERQEIKNQLQMIIRWNLMRRR